MSIIIVNYNGGEYLRRCIGAIEAQTLPPREVILVDNASSDGSIEQLDPLPGHFRIVRSGTNLGFAAANNLAACQARSPWIATLNPDAFPDPHWLQELMAATIRYPDVAMFGSTQIDAEDPNRLDGTGDIFHATGLVWRSGHGAPIAALPPEGEVFSPCGAAALFRRDRFLSVGGFDEAFFCYCEDVDLAFRLRLSGERCIQVAAARVRHVGSGIAGRRSAFATYHGARNRIWLFVKNLPGPMLAVLLPGHILINLLLLIRAMIASEGKSALRGMIDAIRDLGRVLCERRRIQAGRKISMWRLAGVISWSLPSPLIRPFRVARRAHSCGTHGGPMNSQASYIAGIKEIF